MDRRLDQMDLGEIQRRVADLVGLPLDRVQAEREPGASPSPPILLVRAGRYRFAAAWRPRGDAATIGVGVRSILKVVADKRGSVTPLVVAPFIGEVGQELCEEAGVSWLDLSGNAHLLAPGLRVSVQGKPNKYKHPGRPRSVFAPKSSRIARCLLMEPDRAFTQRELARAAGLDEGFTSRIVRHMGEQDLVIRPEVDRVKVRDPEAMLAAWREAYDFSRHRIVRGHIAARSGEEVLHRLASQLRQEGVQHAATGLAGAWLMNHFAGFRLVAIYVARNPSAQSRHAMDFREEPRGENVWLVVPKDQGVFDGASERGGVWCVHPVQAYLDLKGHPERSAEAAEELRRHLFGREVHV